MTAPSDTSRDPARVKEMFGGIAPRYDFLNHLLSLGIDRYWRRRTARALAADRPRLVLDVCGGTGDLSAAVARAVPDALVVCSDFSHPMLRLAGPKFARRGVGSRCARVESDGLRLPFPPACFDAVTVAFGVRNFVDRRAGFAEAARVLRPGGRFLVLEFSRPEGPFVGRLYHAYLSRVVPRMGDRASGKTGPYGYLARTIAEFPDASSLAGEIRESGFAATGWTPLTGGIVCIHDARKAG